MAWSCLKDQLLKSADTLVKDVLSSKIPISIPLKTLKKGGRKVPDCEFQRFDPISEDFMEILTDVENRKMEKEEKAKDRERKSMEIKKRKMEKRRRK